MKILAVGAHPDDIEFGCAGTLARLRERGHEVDLMTVCNGSCGSAVTGPDETVAIRSAEAAKAAALLGGRYYCAGVPDLEAVFDNAQRRKTVEIFRMVQPQLVFTHSPSDYMLDHEMTSLLARDATFTATLGNYPTYAERPAPKLKHIPHVYYWAPMEGLDIFGAPVAADLVIDISAALEKKIEMLCCHESQRDWLRAQHGMDEYVEYLKRESARIGALRGFAYGEAFRQHLGHAYPRNDVLGELLG
ncbi:MAG: PIG-L family deacetylase [Kiritimatiellae bacterium]|nr:PIG-L family deacetylase [Kiritimatiellia bacterium]